MNKLIALALVTALSPAVHAKIIGLPAELKGAESTIFTRAVEAIGEKVGCQFQAKDIKKLTAKYEIVSSKEFDSDTANYPGELESFVLKATVEMPAANCANPRTEVCTVAFEAYDENAYDVVSDKTVCLWH